MNPETLAERERALKLELARIQEARSDAQYAEEQRHIAQQRAVHKQLLGSITNEVAVAVLDFHSPDEWLRCNGDHDSEIGTTWPCYTYVLVAELSGATFDRGTGKIVLDASAPGAGLGQTP